MGAVKQWAMEIDELRDTGGADKVYGHLETTLAHLKAAHARLIESKVYLAKINPPSTVLKGIEASITSLESEIKFIDMMLGLIKADGFLS